MVRREVRGEVEDRGVRGPSRRSIGHRACRTPRSCRLIPWTRAFGPSPIGVQEARARSRPARSALIWEIPAKVKELLGHRHVTTTQIYDKRRRSLKEGASHDVPI